jgi:hypothetical protein
MQDLSGFLWDALIRKQNLMAPKMINKLRAIWIGLGKKTNKFSDFGNEPLFLAALIGGRGGAATASGAVKSWRVKAAPNDSDSVSAKLVVRLRGLNSRPSVFKTDAF